MIGSVFKQKSHSCKIATTKFDLNRASSQTAIDKAPRNGFANSIDQKQIQFLFTLQFSAAQVRRDKAMKCSRITQNDDSTFPSLKLIRETGAN